MINKLFNYIKLIVLKSLTNVEWSCSSKADIAYIQNFFH
jgi:hypothetical protein